jgi:hypothetical protein
MTGIAWISRIGSGRGRALLVCPPLSIHPDHPQSFEPAVYVGHRWR